MPPESSAGFLLKMFSGRPTSASRAKVRVGSPPAVLPRVLPQRKGDVLGDRHAVEQRRLLEEEAESDPLPGQLPLAAVRRGFGRRSGRRRE